MEEIKFFSHFDRASIERPVIHVFFRHYREDLNSKRSRDPNKKRPIWYSAKACAASLINPILKSAPLVEASFILWFDGTEDELRSDSVYQQLASHSPNSKLKFFFADFAQGQHSGAWESFKSQLQYCMNESSIMSRDILYFVENDYLHQPYYLSAITEFFSSGLGDYLCLYDNPDYYRLYMNQNVVRNITHTTNYIFKSEHLLTASFACEKKTLLEDYPTIEWKKEDFDIFSRLRVKGRKYWTPVPGQATHCMEGLLSPTVNWETVNANFGG